MKRFCLFFWVIVGSFALVFTGCKKDNTSTTSKTNTADEINTFIWNGMRNYYLWVDNVPNLTNSYYNTNTDSLNNFLNKYTDHSKLFYDLLYQYNVIDKWSWIVSDYVALENQFAGITKSMGYDFMLARYGTGSNVLGYVRYIVKGSPADKAGLKRGNIFTMVNDQQLTVSNYMDLLVNSQSYKLSFDTILNNTLTLTGSSASLTAVEVTEDPIFLDTVYSVNNQKIGYLMYNAFTANYDNELNNVFQKFQSAGINNLILDLRYNGGGSVQSAIYLASMIYGTYTNKVFLETSYNTLLQSYLTQTYGSSYFNEGFTDYIINSDNSQTPINTLNLPQVYIITTDNTASASEIVINGLKPYINVITVGTNTDGKYVASITVKDYIDSKGTVNPNHTWALQPIVLKISNSQGVSDFVNGFTPQVVLEEDIANLSVLGDQNEPLLNQTLSLISGNQKKNARISTGFKVSKLASSKEFIPHTQEMYFNKRLKK